MLSKNSPSGNIGLRCAWPGLLTAMAKQWRSDVQMAKQSRQFKDYPRLPLSFLDPSAKVRHILTARHLQ
jgi:hypothetical protein